MTHEQLLYLDKLKKALEWFADEENYQCIEHDDCEATKQSINIPVNWIGLEKAKRALENK